MSGAVEHAVRANLREGEHLRTPAKGASFTVAGLEHEALVLLLGKKKASTPIRWSCLEGVPDFLRGRGWVPIGSVFDTSGEPGTLDSYLKTCLKRATAGWVAVVLERAGVLDIDRTGPARVRRAATLTSLLAGTRAARARLGATR